MARPRTSSADPAVVGSLFGGSDGDARPTLVAQLVDRIEEAILSGSLTAGERVNADVFAEHYRISRIPVREALRALEAQGWISALPRLGYFVREKSSEEIYDLFETRLVLEPAATAIAAERRTSVQIDELRRVCDEAHGAERAGDGARLSLLNQQFHSIIAAATHNVVLQSMLEPLGKRVRFYTVLADSRRETSVHEHEAIIDAILRRDSSAAANLARDHILATREAPELPKAIQAAIAV